MLVSCSDDKQDSVHKKLMCSQWKGATFASSRGYTGRKCCCSTFHMPAGSFRALPRKWCANFLHQLFWSRNKSRQATSHLVNSWHSASVIGGVSLSRFGSRFQFRKILELAIGLGLELERWRGQGWHSLPVSWLRSPYQQYLEAGINPAPDNGASKKERHSSQAIKVV